MKKLLIIIPFIIFLSSCSPKVLPSTSDPIIAAKEIQHKEDPFPWYNVVAGGIFLTIIIVSWDR